MEGSDFLKPEFTNRHLQMFLGTTSYVKVRRFYIL